MSRISPEYNSQSIIGSGKTHVRVGFKVALAGNPNCGKSTIFNELTGAHQHVGNWPGKTVEKKEGLCTVDGPDGQKLTFDVVDLPGAYSVSAFSAEEGIAMSFLLDDPLDAVIVVVDAGNLERNLFLTTQIIEMGLPVLLVLNMMDAVEAAGITINFEQLSRGLGGIPIVPTAARAGRGIDALKKQIAALMVRKHEQLTSPEDPQNHRSFKVVDYGKDLESEITVLEALVEETPALAARYIPRWLAIKLLENDPLMVERITAVPEAAAVLAAGQEAVQRIESMHRDESDILITDRRYGFINGLVREVVQRPRVDRLTQSDRLDQFITHPIWGIPIFAAVMWFVFYMTSTVSAYFVDWIDLVLSGPVSRWISALMVAVSLDDSWVESLLLDGVITGVGGVLVFVPVLGFMYFFIANLEDSGYMARAAFLMDRVMHALGLHGKSFIPMLLGFGCSVPGIYATRTLKNRNDRILTALLVPFMSCGARLPIYLAIGVAFFGGKAGQLVFAMYALGVGVALLSGILLRNTLFREKEMAPFVIELPPYRLPALKSVLIHTWERTRSFVWHAATIILAATVGIWFLLAMPVNAPEDAEFASVETEDSALVALSSWLAPVFSPAGFGTWQATSSLVTGILAKEVVLSTLNIVYVGDVSGPPAAVEAPPTFWQDVKEIAISFLDATWNTLRATINILPGIQIGAEAEEEPVADAALTRELQAAFTPLSAVAFCVFALLMIPCISTLATLRQEFGLKWMAFSMLYSLTLAWLFATITYQGGRLLGLG